MALTLEAEQRLDDAGLVAFFKTHEAAWLATAKKTYAFIKHNFPAGAEIRHDDVAKALKPVLEVDKALKDELHRGKLKQKFWISDFTDLIIERTWARISV